MNEDAFRAFLTACGYTDKSVASRLARARAIERSLRADLESLDLSESGVALLRGKLAAAGMAGATLSNALNAARTYARFRSGAAARPAPLSGTSPPRRPPATIAEHPRAAIVSAASVFELMRLYSDVLAELRSRSILRTANGPVGDYAEVLFARAFGWMLAPNSAAHHDAIDPAGTRYQIKARRIGGAGSRQLGDFRGLPGSHFDLLAAVLFDRDMQVLRAALIPYRVVVEHAKRVEHTNSWRFMLNDQVWLIPTVRDVTEVLREAARQF